MPQLEDTELVLVTKKNLPQDLKDLDLKDSTVSSHFKFGVLLCKKGQNKEEQMFGNEDGDETYHRFLEILGEKVKMSGFNGYLAGLDNKTNTTGPYSIASTWNEYQIMYHVSTLLPHSQTEDQQVQKKRHIGNDIVMVVFQEEGSEVFEPTCVKTNFIQIIIVVRVLKNAVSPESTYYRVTVAKQCDVPNFGPPLPYPPIFKHGFEFRQWLMRKMVNAELAGFRGKLLKHHTRTTFKAFLGETYEKYMSKKNRKKTVVNRVAVNIKSGLKKSTN